MFFMLMNIVRFNMPSDMKQINARITGEQWQIIEQLMEIHEMSLAQLIRAGLAELAAQGGLNDRVFWQTPQHGGKREKDT